MLRIISGIFLFASLLYYSDLKPTLFNPIAQPGSGSGDIVFLTFFSFTGGFLNDNFGLSSWFIPTGLIFFEIKEEFKNLSFFFEIVFFLSFLILAVYLANLVSLDGVLTGGGFGRLIEFRIEDDFLRLAIFFIAFLFISFNFSRYKLNPLVGSAFVRFYHQYSIYAGKLAGRYSEVVSPKVKESVFRLREKITNANLLSAFKKEPLPTKSEALLDEIINDEYDLNGPFEEMLKSGNTHQETPVKSPGLTKK